MAKRFVYFYFVKDEPDLLREVVPSHVQYWKTRRLDDYMGGPFADRTGGLISFKAAGLAKARELIEADPFALHGLIESRWIEEWVPE